MKLAAIESRGASSADRARAQADPARVGPDQDDPDDQDDQDHPRLAQMRQLPGHRSTVPAPGGAGPMALEMADVLRAPPVPPGCGPPSCGSRGGEPDALSKPSGPSAGTSPRRSGSTSHGRDRRLRQRPGMHELNGQRYRVHVPEFNKLNEFRREVAAARRGRRRRCARVWLLSADAPGAPDCRWPRPGAGVQQAARAGGRAGRAAECRPSAGSSGSFRSARTR